MLEYGVLMKKKYALAVATTLLAAEAVLAAPSGDRTVITCTFDDMFGNSCYWRCPDMEDSYRTEKKDGRCAQVLYRCANYPRSYMRSSVGSSEIWITPDKYKYFFGTLPQEFDCSISDDEQALMGSNRQSAPTPYTDPVMASKFQNTSTYDESKNLLIDNRDGIWIDFKTDLFDGKLRAKITDRTLNHLLLPENCQEIASPLPITIPCDIVSHGKLKIDTGRINPLLYKGNHYDPFEDNMVDCHLHLEVFSVQQDS